jgi:hypothetical protein
MSNAEKLSVKIIERQKCFMKATAEANIVSLERVALAFNIEEFS